MNKRLVLSLALILLIVGLIIVFASLYGQFFAGADTASIVSKPEISTVQSFLVFGGSMIGTAFILFVLLNRIGG